MAKKRCGAYLLTVGDSIYIGSSWDVDRRRASHVSDLRSGIHPCKKLQAAWEATPESVACSIVRPVKQEDGELDTELRDKLRAAEQELLDLYKGNERLANKSLNARGPDTRQDMKEKWKNPAFRKMMKEALANRPAPSKETREKMAQAKRGENNHKSRPVTVVWPCDKPQHYACGADAAKALGVTQQLVDAWLKGIVALPGRGRTCRKKHLCGIDVFYTDSK